MTNVMMAIIIRVMIPTAHIKDNGGSGSINSYKQQ